MKTQFNKKLFRVFFLLSLLPSDAKYTKLDRLFHVASHLFGFRFCFQETRGIAGQAVHSVTAPWYMQSSVEDDSGARLAISRPEIYTI